MTYRRSSPPRLVSWLLRLRPLGERRRDVTADLLELFQQRVQQHGASYARRRYYHDVLSVWFRLPARVPGGIPPGIAGLKTRGSINDPRCGAGSVQDGCSA